MKGARYTHYLIRLAANIQIARASVTIKPYKLTDKGTTYPDITTLTCRKYRTAWKIVTREKIKPDTIKATFLFI